MSIDLRYYLRYLATVRAVYVRRVSTAAAERCARSCRLVVNGKGNILKVARRADSELQVLELEIFNLKLIPTKLEEK